MSYHDVPPKNNQDKETSSDVGSHTSKEESFIKRVQKIESQARGGKNKKTLRETSKQEEKKSWNLFSRILADFAGAVIFCVLLGIFLDNYFKASHLFLMILLPLGLATGLYNIYKITNKM